MRALLAMRAIAFAYAALGLWSMIATAPRVPYADPCRFHATFLSLPFPDNVLAATPNLRAARATD